MLTHPTLDLLHALGLHGMAQGYKALQANEEARSLDHAEWLGLLLDHETPHDSRSASRPAPGQHIFAIPLASKMSITAPIAASIGLCS